MTDFIEKSQLKPYQIHHKGDPKYKSKPHGEKLSRSLLSIETSKADFSDLAKQIKDTIRYLERHKDKLGHIKVTNGIDYAVLDFGIDLRIDGKQVLAQFDRFPNALIKLAGELGLDIELSIYSVNMQHELEKITARKKRSPRKKSR